MRSWFKALLVVLACTGAGNFASWCWNYRHTLYLGLVPSLLLTILLCVALREGVRSGNSRMHSERSWALLTAGSAAIPAFVLLAEFALNGFILPTFHVPLLLITIAAFVIPISVKGWRGAQIADWGTVMGAWLLLLGLTHLLWLPLRLYLDHPW